MQRMQRLGQCLALTAVALMLLLPLADHHWAERLPVHEHLALSGDFDVNAHTHTGETDRSHHAHSSQGANGRVVAFSAYDAGSSGLGFGLLTVQMSDATTPVAPPDVSVAVGPHVPLSSGETVPPPAPPPRVSL